MDVDQIGVYFSSNRPIERLISRRGYNFDGIANFINFSNRFRNFLNSYPSDDRLSIIFQGGFQRVIREDLPRASKDEPVSRLNYSNSFARSPRKRVDRVVIESELSANS